MCTEKNSLEVEVHRNWLEWLRIFSDKLCIKKTINRWFTRWFPAMYRPTCINLLSHSKLPWSLQAYFFLEAVDFMHFVLQLLLAMTSTDVWNRYGWKRWPQTHASTTVRPRTLSTPTVVCASVPRPACRIPTARRSVYASLRPSINRARVTCSRYQEIRCRMSYCGRRLGRPIGRSTPRSNNE